MNETDFSNTNPIASLLPERLLFGRSSLMQEVRQSVGGVAGTAVSILIVGERGTGKELVAREIHRRSPWASSPFLKVSSELDSVLNSWPGSESRPPDGSSRSVFIDEVGRLSAAMQAKLLEFFHDGLESQSTRRPDTRVICSSTRNLEDDVVAGSFRLDLFYRINVVTINVPPLRDRREDIPDLTEYFFESACSVRNRSCRRIPIGLAHLFYEYAWPGNIRELETYVRTYVEGDGDAALLEGLLFDRRKREVTKSTDSSARTPLKVYTRQLVQQAESDLILRVLREQRWNRKETAKVLQVSYQTLLHKLKTSGLSKRRSKRASAQEVGEGQIP
jgi:two-component system, NtrC family, response regulator AtoC